MKYGFDKFTWADNTWSMTGASGMIDFRSLPDQALAGTYGSHPWAFVAYPDDFVTGPDFILLGEGHLSTIDTTSTMLDQWETTLGYRPNGDTLLDLLEDQLTFGSDPTGENGNCPLMPTVAGFVNIHLGGHSLIRQKKFVWGEGHTEKVKAVLHRNFRAIKAENVAAAANMRDLVPRLSGSWASIVSSTNTVNVRNRSLLVALRARGLTVQQARQYITQQATKHDEHDRRVLDYWRIKYKLKGENWKELVPVEDRDNHPGPLPHETTYTESFNTSNGDTLGPDLTWTETTGDIDISSNQAVTISSSSLARAEHDLSSDDMEVYIDVVNFGGTNRNAHVYGRWSSSAETAYTHVVRNNSTITYRLSKVVAGTFTALNTINTTAPGSGVNIGLIVDGSDLTGIRDAVSRITVTDTSITGHLRSGFGGGAAAGTTFDNFSVSDLATSSFQAAWARGSNVVLQPGVICA